jgi:uncharacterized radical SAM superfamily Fe-S cluster-containing enzyme
VAFFGRNNLDLKERSTLSGIVGKIEKQTKGRIRESDLIPHFPDEILFS